MKFIASPFRKENRILLLEMVRSDFKLRYQGSSLGYLWSLLKPLMIFGVLYFVFTRFLRFGDTVPNYAVSLLLGIVLWNFFTEATSRGLSSIIERGDLIRKIKIPRYIIVLSSTVSALINLFLNLIVVLVFVVFSSADMSIRIIWFIPILIELFVLTLGISFFISAAYVRFRDISYIWEVSLQILFYATPILYPLSVVPDFYKSLIMLNPLAQIIQDAKYALIYSDTQQLYDVTDNLLLVMFPFGVIILVVLAAVFYFRKESKLFAENI